MFCQALSALCSSCVGISVGSSEGPVGAVTVNLGAAADRRDAKIHGTKDYIHLMGFTIAVVVESTVG